MTQSGMIHKNNCNAQDRKYISRIQLRQKRKSKIHKINYKEPQHMLKPNKHFTTQAPWLFKLCAGPDPSPLTLRAPYFFRPSTYSTYWPSPWTIASSLPSPHYCPIPTVWAIRHSVVLLTPEWTPPTQVSTTPLITPSVTLFAQLLPTNPSGLSRTFNADSMCDPVCVGAKPVHRTHFQCLMSKKTLAWPMIRMLLSRGLRLVTL